MTYIKLLDVPLRCPNCGVTRVALGMGQHTSVRSSLDGELPTLAYNNRCPDCGLTMDVDQRLKDR